MKEEVLNKSPAPCRMMTKGCGRRSQYGMITFSATLAKVRRFRCIIDKSRNIVIAYMALQVIQPSQLQLQTKMKTM